MATAVMAGIVEEVIFRKWIMDYLDKRDMGMLLQVLASGLAFGFAHATWGNWRGASPRRFTRW